MRVKNKKNATILFLQLVAFMHLWRTEVNAEMVEGCVESKLTLTCNETKMINISSVVLGDSPGCPDANCCPKINSCTAKPNDNHINEVHRRCNGRQSCVVDVIHERIPCESNILVNYRNDFERITYDCIDNGGIKSTAYCTEMFTTTTFAAEDKTDESTVISGIDTTKGVQIRTEASHIEDVNNSGAVLAIAVTIIFTMTMIIILIAIILKKKKTWLRAENKEELLEARNLSNEAIDANEDQIQIGNTQSSSLSIDRTHKYQNSREISNYEQANKVILGCKTTPLVPAEFWNERDDVDFVSTNNNQTAMDQASVCSVAKNDDISGFDSNFVENRSAVYVNLEPQKPGKVPPPGTGTSVHTYEEVFNRMPSCAELANSAKQAASFSSPTAIYQNTQHARADDDDTGAVSKQEDGLYKNFEEIGNKHVLCNNEMYELTIPQLELR